MAAPAIQEHLPGDMSEAPAGLSDIFDLDPRHQDIGELGVWLGGEEDEQEDDGVTTGDGCGESPPQGPTSGC
ncbi:hypothetical protein [Streptomyces sp. NBC_01508]|uniref:hypothetical protein n=1 Tax=Streptomyces sp. NBC_01508 TaxID=2903888 RepID=UPI00386DD14B